VPCWPDIWERIRHFLPLFSELAFVFAYIALVTLLLWAPKLRKRWLLVTSRVLGVAALVPGAIMLPVVFFGSCIGDGQSARRNP